MQKKSENRINDVISNAMKTLNGLIDVNTVVGSPIKTDDGAVVIPVSKVTFGTLCGGGEYGKLNVFRKNDELPFSAGNGAIVSVNPCGFLIKEKNGEYKILAVSKNSYQAIFDKTAEIIKENLKNNEE